MSAPTFDASLSREALSSDFDLTIRQQPDRARVAGGKEKERKPIDPPPIVQLRVREEGTYLAHFGAAVTGASRNPGFVLHRLKDVDNTDGGFFVFGDLSVKIDGEFRLKFTLFEMRRDMVVYLKTILSERFTVYPPKSFPGMMESTFLSRSFADQGVKLRIRKEPRTGMAMKRAAPPPDYSHGLPPRSPDRQPVQIPPASAGFRYPASTQDYGYAAYGAPTKRHRTSIDYGRQSMYPDPERMARPMDTYGQPIYQQHPNAYQTPAMQYSTGQVVPDYGMSYGLPPSASIPQMSDPTRSSQQAAVGQLMAMNQPGTPTSDSKGAMMAQDYSRAGYPANSTVLPPLQAGYPQGTNGGSRNYFEQPSPAVTPVLPSQMVGGDRFGSAPTDFDIRPPGSANGTPR
ncbi:Velvet factor [Penicillium chermesinum]|uniref:Velvet factor n=1 Tax=Penicillium chermesinum TaxID=63820 RepID=A0A9W9TIF8_9EURO|nr:Velvet factor [Penicillium chermesinum]KAJ5224027.1 Velvet factor [Penicillium chermesinum]